MVNGMVVEVVVTGIVVACGVFEWRGNWSVCVGGSLLLCEDKSWW